MSDFKNSNLVNKLIKLNASEYIELGKWLKSPWCNSNKKLYEIHQSLRKHYPNFDSSSFSKEWLFGKLYPNKKYNPTWIRNLIGELSKQIDSFLIHQYLKTNQNMQKFMLREQFLSRNNMLEFNEVSNQIIDSLETKSIKSWLDFLQLTLLYEGQYFQPNSSMKIQSGQDILSKAENYLDSFYAIGKYRLLNEYAERKKILMETNHLEKKTRLMKLMAIHVDLPIIKYYQLRLKTKHKSPLEKYLSLKEFFVKNGMLLPIKEQKVFLLSLINDASKLKVSGYKEGLPEMFEIYQIGLQTKLLIHQGQITDRSYTNIITISNLLSKTDYSKEFIGNYTCFLPEKIQNDAYTWGQAHTYYYEEKLKKARNLLAQYSFHNATFSIQGKLLLFQIYFDLSKNDDSFQQPFIDFSYAAEKFFRRNKVLSKERKQAYLNLFQYVRKINNLLLRSAFNEQLKKEWISRIEADENLHGRKWLKNKIIEI